MDHLCIGRLMPLAVAMRAGNDGDRSGLVKADFHPVVERRGEIDERAHTDAAQLATRFAVRLAGGKAGNIGDFCCMFGNAGKIARIVDRRHQRSERHLFLGDVIALANLHRVDANFIRRDIKQAFYNVNRFGPPCTTIGPGPGGVAEHDADMDMHRLVFVNVRIHHRADAGGYRCGGGQIGTEAVIGHHADGEYLAVCIQRHLAQAFGVPAMGVADQRFRPGCRPFDRAAQAHSGPGAHRVLGEHAALHAETTTDIGGNYAESRRRLAENLVIGGSVLMGTLARHVDCPVLL